MDDKYLEEVCEPIYELIDRVTASADRYGLSRNRLWRIVMCSLMGIRLKEKREEENEN